MAQNISISVRVPTRYKEQLSETGSLGPGVKAKLVEAVEAFADIPESKSLPIKVFPDEPSVAVIIGINTDQNKILEKVLSRANFGDLPMSQKCRFILTAWIDRAADAPDEKEGSRKDAKPVESFVPQGEDALVSALKQMSLSPRHEQKLLFQHTSAHLEAQDGLNVLFAEAGTGIGKTLVYLIQAATYIKQQRDKGTPARVCICAPNYSHITQIMSTWDESLMGIFGFRPIALGSKKDFVSEQRLRELIEQLEENCNNETVITEDLQQKRVVVERAKAWMRDPVPPPGFRSTAHWTLEGLLYAAPVFEDGFKDDITLDSRHDDGDLGWISYRDQFVHAHGSDMWVMTHALLASKTKQRMLMKKRIALLDENVVAMNDALIRDHNIELKLMKEAKEKGTLKKSASIDPLSTQLNELYEDAAEQSDEISELPDFDLLLIDEAHALDAAFDLVLSSRISIWSLIKDLEFIAESTPTHAATSSKLKRIFQQLKASAPIGSSAFSRTQPMSSAADRMQSILDCLKSIKEPKNKAVARKCAQEYRRIRAATRALDIAMKHKDDPRGMVGTIDHSPDRNWPRLVIGRSSLQSEMDYLWRHVAEKTILLSATLYDTDTMRSVNSMRLNLHVPIELTRTMTPIHPRWSIEPVTVCTVAKTSRPDGSPKFIRPSKDKSGQHFEALHNAWCEDVAHYIWSAHHPLHKGQGGMLVLCTAFEDIEKIAKRIDVLMGKANNRHTILSHKKDAGLEIQKIEFFKLISKDSACRPIFLACGAGWTGFDLSWADMPDAVTDLVIVNAPFGVLPDMVSKKRRGFMTTVTDMEILLRQGLGRLIRHMLAPGATRRIHWLDGRIHQQESSSWTNRILRILGKYPRQITV